MKKMIYFYPNANMLLHKNTHFLALVQEKEQNLIMKGSNKSKAGKI